VLVGGLAATAPTTPARWRPSIVRASSPTADAIGRAIRSYISGHIFPARKSLNRLVATGSLSLWIELAPGLDAGLLQITTPAKRRARWGKGSVRAKTKNYLDTNLAASYYAVSLGRINVRPERR